MLGLGIMHPYYKQYVVKMEMVLHEPMNDTSLGKLINCLAEEVKREAGCFGPVGDIPIVILNKVVTNSWLKLLLLFVAERDIHIHNPLPHLAPKRTGDKALVQMFYEMGAAEENLKMLQQCCQFTGLTTLLDAVTMDGKSIWPCLHCIDTAV